MRRAVILATLALLLLVVAGVTAAQDPLAKGGNSNKTYNLRGEVVSASDTSVVVDVEKGNGAARQFEGQQKTFVVSSATRVDREEVRISAADLVAGEEVRVQSRAAANLTDDFPTRRTSVKDDGGGTTGGPTSGTTEDSGGS